MFGLRILLWGNKMETKMKTPERKYGSAAAAVFAMGCYERCYGYLCEERWSERFKERTARNFFSAQDWALELGGKN